jgi:translation initiation factor 1 (eIF-1/SUI1)
VPASQAWIQTPVPPKKSTENKFQKTAKTQKKAKENRETNNNIKVEINEVKNRKTVCPINK